MKGKILRFLRVIKPLHFSRRFTYLRPYPPIPYIAALQLHPRLLALPSPSEGKLLAHVVVSRPSTREPNDVVRLLKDHLLPAIELLEMGKKS